ncbi:hypothetical protein LCGC14_2873360, partial [marine sediment metagenome]
ETTMGNLRGIIPFSEGIERTMNLVREDAINARDKFKGLYNDAYTRDIPNKPYDWRPLMKSSQISCAARYNTGTVAVNAAATAITGTGTTWTSAMTGFKMRIGSNSNIYTFTYVSATTGTISPGLSGANDLTGVGYDLFDDDYTMATDFSRLLKGGSVYRMIGGRVDETLNETHRVEWNRDYVYWPIDLTERIRLLGYNSSRVREVQINPPPKTAIMLPYDYIYELMPLTEYNTGYITTLANGAAVVTGSGTDFDGYVDSSLIYYFRIDRDGIGDSSVWYELTSADSDTGLTLASNYAGVALVGAEEAYTLCMIPDLPSEFHDWIQYIAAISAAGDQDDPMVQLWTGKAKEIERRCMSLYKTRRVNIQIEVEDDVRG